MIIAIDPDMKKPGVCFLNDGGEITHLCSMTIPDLIHQIHTFKDADYVIEDVNKIGAMYRDKKTDSQGVKNRKAQNVGMVKASGKIIYEIIKDITGKSPSLAPVGLGKQVKKNAKLFKELTGWQGKTNEDMRDAAAIALWYHNQLVRPDKRK